MNTFKLTISSPNGNKYSEDTYNLVVRGTLGELAVMAGHIPLVTAVKPCDCFVWKDDNSFMQAKCDGGLLTVSKDEVTLLTGNFEWNNE